MKVSVSAQQAKTFADRHASEMLDNVGHVQWSVICFTAQAPNGQCMMKSCRMFKCFHHFEVGGQFA